MVKFAHSIFALPFAAVGFVLGYLNNNYVFTPHLLIWVLVAMITARNAAMAFNRYIDRQIDARNNRTAKREIPAGLISPKNALRFVIFNALVFMLTAYLISPLCFWLSPVALFVILTYSFFKRFSFLAHYILGLGLGIAPVGAYLAFNPNFQWPIILLALSVLFWVAGFDIIYALQDIDFDREQKLKSVPSVFGYRKAKKIALFSHLLSALLMLLFIYFINIDNRLYLAAGIFIFLIFYQHIRVYLKGDGVINAVFFTVNGIASLSFGIVFICILLLR